MRRLETTLVVLMILAPGCAGPGIPRGCGSGHAAATGRTWPATTRPPGQTLTSRRLRNAAYPLPEANGNLIQFTDGKFRGPVVLGSIEEVRFNILDRVGRGDLDGDGVEDAALIMVKDPTEDKPEYTLWAVINQSGVPDPRGCVLLGEQCPGRRHDHRGSQDLGRCRAPGAGGHRGDSDAAHQGELQTPGQSAGTRGYVSLAGAAGNHRDPRCRISPRLPHAPPEQEQGRHRLDRKVQRREPGGPLLDRGRWPERPPAPGASA